MINLEDVANTLEKLLNNTPQGVERPASLMNTQFAVKAEGVILDKVYDLKTGKNFIPIYVGLLGGEINPVPELGEIDYNIPVAVYFPVSQKKNLFDLQQLLYDLFVGQIRSYGNDKALSNISIPQIGEAEYMDIEQFKRFVNDTYRLPISTNEAWMSISFNLYLSTVKGLGEENGFIYGNSWKMSLSFLDYNDKTKLYEDENPTFVEVVQTESGESASQQVLETYATQSLMVNSAYAKRFTLYVKNTEFYKALFDLYRFRRFQNIPFNVVESCQELGYSEFRYYLIQNIDFNIRKGSLMTVSLTLIDAVDELLGD